VDAGAGQLPNDPRDAPVTVYLVHLLSGATLHNLDGCRWSAAADAAGNVYFASDHCIFKLDQRGIMTRVAGTARGGYSGDGGPATSAQLNYPYGLVFDDAGNLLIADTNNHRIRKIAVTGIITTVAGGETPGASGDGGPAVSAHLNFPESIAADLEGNFDIVDSDYHAGTAHLRKVSTKGIINSVATRKLTERIGAADYHCLANGGTKPLQYFTHLDTCGQLTVCTR
jgi:NHL repeat